MALKPLLLNHPSSPDTSTKRFWMAGKGIHGLEVLHQTGICQLLDFKNQLSKYPF
jgi:hypothetical protein